MGCDGMTHCQRGWEVRPSYGSVAVAQQPVYHIYCIILAVLSNHSAASARLRRAGGRCG